MFHYCVFGIEETQEQNCSVFLQQMQEALSFSRSSRAKTAAGGRSYWASCWLDLRGINAEFLTTKQQQIIRDQIFVETWMQMCRWQLLGAQSRSGKNSKCGGNSAFLRAFVRASTRRAPDPFRDRPKYVKTVQRVEFPQLAPL